MRTAFLGFMVALAACDSRSTEELAKIVSTANPESAVKIEQRAQAILSGLKSNGQGDSSEAADAGDVALQARIVIQDMDSDDSLALAEEIARIRKSHPDGKLHRSLYYSALAHYLHDDTAKAAFDLMDDATRSIEQFKDSVDASQAAETYMGYANFLQSEGDYAEARKRYDSALNWLETSRSPDPRVVGKVQHNYGDLLIDLGDYDAAAERLQIALGVRMKLDPTGREVAETHNALGGCAEQVADFDGAEKEYQQALDVYGALGDRFAKRVADVKSNAGMVAFARGHFDAADKDYVAALCYFRSHGKADREIAHVLSNQGELVLARKGTSPRLESAHALFSEAFEKRCVAFNAPNPAKLVEVAASCKALTEEPDTDKPADFDAWKAMLALTPAHPDIAESLAQLGRVDIEAGRPKIARARLARALEIWTGAFGPQHPLCGSAKRDLAQACVADGDSDEGFRLARDADSIIRDHIRQTVSRLPERGTLRYAASLPKPKDLVVGVAEAERARWRDAYDTVIRSRALVLDEEAGRWEAVGLSDDPSIEEARKAFQAASRRCGYLALRPPVALSVEEYSQARDTACADADAKEEVLARVTERSPLLQSRRQKRQFGVDQIIEEARKLPSSSALVSYVRYERTPGEPLLGAFVLDPPSGRIQFIPLEPVERVNALVDDWRRQFNKDARDPSAYRTAATALREAVWDKIENELDGAFTIFIVPDGKLNLVSFATFPSRDEGYLVQKHNFHYLSAERDLVPHVRTAPNGLLVASGPAFDLPAGPLPPVRAGVVLDDEAFRFQRSLAPEARCLELVPAPHGAIQDAETRAKELIGLADKRGKGNLPLWGPAVSKPGFEALASSFRDVYLLTHAEVDEPAATDAVASARGDDPLLQSRLLFAGADCHKWSDAKYPDTGVITAKDFAGLNLSNVSLLILHACKTGTGSQVDVDEGVLGLRRAVHTAGAGSIVMTLWEVDDLRTQPWITDLLKRRYEKPKPESLVEAVNGATRDRYEALGPKAHPYWWGGFVSEGDWR